MLSLISVHTVVHCTMHWSTYSVLQCIAQLLEGEWGWVPTVNTLLGLSLNNKGTGFNALPTSVTFLVTHLCQGRQSACMGVNDLEYGFILKSLECLLHFISWIPSWHDNHETWQCILDWLKCIKCSSVVLIFSNTAVKILRGEQWFN